MKQPKWPAGTKPPPKVSRSTHMMPVRAPRTVHHPLIGPHVHFPGFVEVPSTRQLTPATIPASQPTATTASAIQQPVDAPLCPSIAAPSLHSHAGDHRRTAIAGAPPHARKFPRSTYINPDAPRENKWKGKGKKRPYKVCGNKEWRHLRVGADRKCTHHLCRACCGSGKRAANGTTCRLKKHNKDREQSFIRALESQTTAADQRD